MFKLNGFKGQFKISSQSITAHNQNKEFPTANESYNKANKANKLGTVEERKIIKLACGRDKATKKEIASYIIGKNDLFDKYWVAE